MRFYAQLNENKICVGISQLSGEVKQENMVEIDTFDSDYLWKKYENEEWSTVKYEPTSTAPLSEFEKLQAENAQLKDAVDTLIIDNLNMQMQIDTLIMSSL